MADKFSNLKESSLDPGRRQQYVTELFDDLAPRYDRFNRWVSFFRDETWRRKTVQLLGDRASGVILDLAAGTGDLAQSAAKAGARQVHLFDISLQMLRLAEKKLRPEKKQPGRIFLEQGSANKLPFRNESFDGIVSGFAMRNIFHFLDEVVLELHRILKPGGRFAILELSQPKNAILNCGFRFHLKMVTPVVGKLITGKYTPFKYLTETTLTFLSPESFQSRLQNAGFVEVKWRSFLLGGIAIHYGEKPAI